jgi:predicted nucleotidyltransferase
MRKVNNIRKTLIPYMPIIKQKYNVEKLGVFGSYVRGKQKKIVI